jgi:FlaA1/EpsC-like NDP-sugar epimerase
LTDDSTMTMKYRLFYKNFFVILGIDIILLACSLYAAYLVRFDFNIPPQNLRLFKQALPFLLIIKISTFYFFDLYRGMWRYTSIADLINVIKASSISTFLGISFALFNYRFEGFSRSVFVIDWCFTLFLIAGCRLFVRFYFEHVSEDKPWRATARSVLGLFKRKRVNGKRLLIIGAGNCGEKICREIRDNASLRYHVVGFLDDYPVKIGKKIHGISVLGPISDIKEVAEQVSADEALIAIPSANSFNIRTIVAHCEKSGIPFKTLPGYGELIGGRVTVNAIRKVAYRDLLGREAVNLDEEGIGAYLKGQSVLVTGAGGSIGSELCKQICRFRPDSILLFERAESPLYEIELELKQNFKGVTVVPILGDIQERLELERAFGAYKPRVVFHAAAYKHVPMLELQPWKAIENNIQGTLNLIETARRFDIDRFVFVSTDKAVRPTNVMGASKRVAEMLVQCCNGDGASHTRFMIVRFGNVAGSVGSVVPLFKKQIENGGPVTVTHREVTRYFMTIPEACQLILQAGALGSGSGVQIFLLDMGRPIRIADMARDLIRLSGFEPDVDIKIEYIGMRPGEKLYEELITEGEGIVPTSHKKILVLRGAECHMEVLSHKIDELTVLAREQEGEKIKAKLKGIVPEYQPGRDER